MMTRCWLYLMYKKNGRKVTLVDMHHQFSPIFWYWQVTEWRGQVVEAKRGETSRNLKKKKKNQPLHIYHLTFPFNSAGKVWRCSVSMYLQRLWRDWNTLPPIIIFSSPPLFSITITTNTDQGVLAAWEHSVLVYSISPDVGFMSTIYRGPLADWTAVTMTRAQQTHDIFAVDCVWTMAVLPEWLTGIFSPGYPVLTHQLRLSLRRLNCAAGFFKHLLHRSAKQRF